MVDGIEIMMKARQHKSQAHASQASSFGGFPSNEANAFGRASSSISYLSETPNFSVLSDSNLIVSFKNLLKRDSTTKTKALEEILNHVHEKSQDGSGGLDDGFLATWVKVFPRASIDIARRVRQTAHTLNGQVVAFSGKRIAKYMPSIIALWLIGIHDGDKAVARAAQDALSLAFPTTEKRDTLKKAYQSAVLEFCSNVINNEKSNTLSDERTTSSEDADAMYNRVLSSSIAAVTTLINELDQKDVQSHNDGYADLFSSSKLWYLFSSKDSQSRRATIRFAEAGLSAIPDLVTANERIISKAVLSKQAMRHQSGTSSEYTRLLAMLTKRNPQIWTMDSEKTTVNEKLQLLVKHGSHGGIPDFWFHVETTFKAIPRQQISTDSTQSQKLLQAIYNGIIGKDEPGTNRDAGMSCYFSAVNLLTAHENDDAREDIIMNMVLPIVQQYVNPAPITEQWALPARPGLPIIIEGLRYQNLRFVIIRHLPDTVDSLIHDLETSSPEQAKEFDSSQLRVEAQGERLFSLLVEMSKGAKSEVTGIQAQARSKIISRSIQLLKSRHGKPYGAAGCIAAALKTGNSATILGDTSYGPTLDDFIVQDLPKMMNTTSQRRLISILYLCENSVNFNEAWDAAVGAVLAINDPANKQAAVESILMHDQELQETSHAQQHQGLQNYVQSRCKSEVEGSSDFTFTDRMLARGDSGLSEASTDLIVQYLVDGLLHEERSLPSLSSLVSLQRTRSKSLSGFLGKPDNNNLIRNLLRVQENGDTTTASIAKQLAHDLDVVATSTTTPSPARSMLMIQDHLREAGPDSISIGTLIDLAVQKLQSGNDHDIQAFLPDFSTWSNTLSPFLEEYLPPSFMITEEVGALCSSLDSGNINAPTFRLANVDLGGFSAPMRMAVFTTRLLSDLDDTLVGQLTNDDRHELFRLLALTARLANDKLGYVESNTIWISYDEEAENNILEFVNEATKLVKKVLSGELSGLEDDPSQWTESLARLLWQHSKGKTGSAMHHGRVFASLTSQIIEETPAYSKRYNGIQDVIKAMRRGEDQYTFAALTIAFRASIEGHPSHDRMINEIVSELTSISPDSDAKTILQGLCQLDLLCRDQPEPLSAIPHQRVIFFVKNMSKCLVSNKLDNTCKALICRALSSAASCIEELYGEHWNAMIDFLLVCWSEAGPLSLQLAGGSWIGLRHASLTLLNTLIKISSDSPDAAEDLKELLADSHDQLAKGLTKLLVSTGSLNDASNQPLRITNELLARLIDRSFKSAVAESSGSDLYALVGAESRALQQTAFNALHSQIPKAQEDVSLAAALDKKVARLPEELLSLILQAPNPEAVEDLSFERQIPATLFTFVSSWLLVFDHYKNASDKVKTDYSAHLRESDVLPGLMGLIFTFLGHTRGRPIDASKFDATNYSFEIETSPIKDLQWLLVHLYYLCLKRCPSLTKAWWIDCKSRQIKTQVEPWTVKHFSSLVQADALATVTAWSATQSDTAPDAITVRTHPTTASLTASKEIDDQTMSILITLPPNFPLGQVTVTDGHRVAVDAKRWNAWKMNTQGVIAFSDNSIPDGLMAWKRNVVGQLKGQTECAICYAIVGADKSLPTKKCGTCSNAFHGGCLYRWFKSSNSSSCPLCRTAFNYA